MIEQQLHAQAEHKARKAYQFLRICHEWHPALLDGTPGAVSRLNGVLVGTWDGFNYEELDDGCHIVELPWTDATMEWHA